MQKIMAQFFEFRFSLAETGNNSQSFTMWFSNRDGFHPYTLYMEILSPASPSRPVSSWSTGQISFTLSLPAISCLKITFYLFP